MTYVIYTHNSKGNLKKEQKLTTLLKETSKSRLLQLKKLRDILASSIDKCDSMRDLASLSRQYRETIKEIEDIEGVNDDVDEIQKILNKRKTNGKSKAVR